MLMAYTNTAQLRAALVECSGSSATFSYRFDQNVKICFEKSVFYSRNINVPQHCLPPFRYTMLYFLLPFNQKEFLEVSTPLLFPLMHCFPQLCSFLKDSLFQSWMLLPAKTNNANL